ncbi:MAG: tripartite tricarboxylate transporter permease [Methanobacterium paludis]|nr:tripartite tricarboxylate transporter permease [Methanobacterium paludis]
MGNPRSGIAVYVDKLLQSFGFNQLMFFVFVSLMAVSLSLFLCLKLGDIVSESIEKINYRKLSWFVIIFMSFLVVLFTVMEHTNLFYIILVYVTAIALGLLPHYVEVNKSNLMGVLILPAIIIYAGLV